MDELLQAIVKSYGIIGLFMLSPIVATVYLWRENVRLNSEMKALSAAQVSQVDQLGQRVVAIQDKRVEDSKGISEKLMMMVSTHAESAKEQTIALDRVGDMVSMLSAQFNGTVPPPSRPPRGPGRGAR